MSADAQIAASPEADAPFEAGRRAGRESATTQPMTDIQARHVRTMLRQAETQPAKAS